MKPAERIANLPPYVFVGLIKRLEEQRLRGVDVINLGPGSPDMPPPRHVIDSLHEWATKPSTHGYAGYQGLPELRQAVANYYTRRFGVSLDAEREVLMLIGSKEGLFNTSLAILNPGDVALVPDPGYPAYFGGAQMAGAERYGLPLREQAGFLPDLKAVPSGVARAARLLWLNYPNNPTGATAGLDFFGRAVDFAREHELLLCHDNPYCEVGFDAYRAPSVLQVRGAKDVCVEFNSLSKTYNMAGWRVGYVVGNAEVIASLALLKSNIDSGIFAPIQRAAVAALTGDQGWLRERNRVYQRRRDTVLAFLPKLGLRAEVPRAAVYVWARLPGQEPSCAFSSRILEETGVLVTPGSAFGEHGEGYIRISLTVPEDRLAAAGERMLAAGSIKPQGRQSDR